EPHIWIRIMNPDNWELKLQSRTKFGTYYYFPIEHEYETRTQSTEDTKVQISEEETQGLLGNLRYLKDDPEIVKQFENLIREYTNVFKTPSQPRTGTYLVQHSIITDHDRPIAKKPYRVPYHRR